MGGLAKEGSCGGQGSQRLEPLQIILEGLTVNRQNQEIGARGYELDKMGDSVPDWEEMCGATEVGISLDSLEHLLKEKWETVELTSEIANLPSMSGHDSNQGAWGDSTNRTGLRTINVEHTDLHRSSLWRREIPLAVTFPEPPSGILVPDVKKCFDGTFNLPTSQEDEMVSWLQYPLEDSLEKECYGVSRKSPGCSFAPPKDIAGDHSSLDFQQNVVGFPRMKKMAAGKEGDAVLGEPQVRESIPEDESEVLTRVRAVRPLVPKGLDLECSGEVVALGLNSASSQHFSTPGMASPMQTSAMEALGSASMLNFPHFSRPAAVVKANLHSLGVSCVPTSQSSQSRLRQSIACTPSALLDPLLALSSMSPNMGLCSPSKSARFGEVLRGTTTQSDSHQQPSDERSGLDTTSCACDVPGKCAISSCFACPTLICDSHQQQLRSKSLETSEATFSSGGSGVSIVQGAKSTTQRIKRKLVEEECPGEDAEDESVDAKRPSSVRSTVTKRSRAAEVHNLSERRRRDRINEKMRALQDLIPNSNKTDKASMLDEAIEYLKMLQLQLKMMSMRSGITLPSMILPPGSPRSRSPLSSVDQGASMESGKHTIFGGGLGWTNLTVPGQRLVPSLCGSTHIFPASTPDDQLRKSVNVDTWNTCLGRPDLQAGNVERYNNSMRLQQQHHHHHQALHESQYQQ